MTSDTNPELALFKEATRDFLKRRAPIGALRALESDDVAFDRTWWRQGAELGWTGLFVPEQFGGGTVSGEAISDAAIIAEELGRVVAPGAFTPVSVVASVLARSESGAHKELMGALASGEAVAAWAVWESGDDHRIDTLQLDAKPQGSGWVLSGTKTRVEAAQAADQLLVLARTPDGLRHFLVPTSATGVRIEPVPVMDLGRRFPSVVFDHVEVDADAIVGTAEGTDDDIQAALLLGALLQCAETCGVIGQVFDLTREYMDSRFTFGRPLSSYQALKHRVADMKMWLEASRGVTAAAVKALQRQQPDAAATVSAAKCYVGERSTDLIQDCIQLHGGIGVTWEHDLHLYLRRATANRFTYGTPDEHREMLAASTGI
jgi:alkylation response protein AidB-like acyl-CoA dehydrogenase